MSLYLHAWRETWGIERHTDVKRQRTRQFCILRRALLYELDRAFDMPDNGPLIHVSDLFE